MAIAFVRWLFWAIMLGKEKNLEIKIQHPKCFSFVGFYDIYIVTHCV